jgi:hypothetical protein
VAWLHERFTRGDFELAYEKSDQQAADAMTKAFTDVSKWEHVCALMNHVLPDKLWKPRRGAAGGQVRLVVCNRPRSRPSRLPHLPRLPGTTVTCNSSRRSQETQLLPERWRVGDKFAFSAEAAQEMTRALESIDDGHHRAGR